MLEPLPRHGGSTWSSNAWLWSIHRVHWDLSEKEGFLVVLTGHSPVVSLERSDVGWYGKKIEGAFLQDIVGTLHKAAEMQGCLFWQPPFTVAVSATAGFSRTGF